MDKRRVAVLLAVAIAVVAGGVVSSRFRDRPPDELATKADDSPPPTPVTKATTPARQLNEKERLLVGKWKFEKVTPALLGGGYQATYEFAADGTFTFNCSKIGIKPWGQRGTYRINGELVITVPEVGETTVNLIEELTEERFVQSAPDGNERWVKVWLRVTQ